MIALTMPADFKRETLDGYARLNAAIPGARVAGTYGCITVGGGFGSGRNVSSLPPIDFEALKAYAAYSREHDIAFAYTFNATYMNNREFTPEGVAEIKALLLRLRAAGITDLIIALPPVIEIARDMDLGFRIKVSTIAGIDNANKALYFKHMGADAIVPVEAINRDFATLRRIRAAFGPGVQLIANVICHQDCHYRMFHYNQNSGDACDVSNDASRGYYLSRCLMRLYDDVSNIFKLSWIRPEDIKHYAALGIENFKLQGRHTVLHGDPVRAAECYMRGRYDGDLKDLLLLFAPTDAYQLSIDNNQLNDFLQPFLDKEGFCAHDCTSCQYCRKWAEQLMDLTTVSPLAAAAVQRLKARDPFAPVAGTPAAK